MRPETRYARSGAYNIAYSVFGDGPIDLVLASGLVSHIEYAWEEPSLARFLRKLATFTRVIMFDKRGTGLSDALGPDRTPSPEERVDDIAAVMDAADSRRAALFGWSEGGASVIALANRHPERVHGAILFGTAARTPVASVYPGGIPDEHVETMFSEWRRQWGTEFGLELLAPSVAEDARMRRWWATCQRLTAGPGTIVASMRVMMDFDMTSTLSQVKTPTLVMHAEGDMVIPLAAARDIASRLCNAQLIVLPGADHVYWLGDQNAASAGDPFLPRRAVGGRSDQADSRAPWPHAIRLGEPDPGGARRRLAGGSRVYQPRHSSPAVRVTAHGPDAHEARTEQAGRSTAV